MTIILSDLLDTAFSEIQDTTSLGDLDDIRVRYLGKKGKITSQLKLLGSMDPNEKPIFGQKINAAKKQVSNQLELKKKELQEKIRTTIATIIAVLITKVFLSLIAFLISLAFSVIIINPTFSPLILIFLIVANKNWL